MPKRPGLRLVLLNAAGALPPERAAAHASAGQVSFDIATLDGVGGMARFLKVVPYERLLFGSFVPFFYLEAAGLKLREADSGDEITAAVESGNAARVLAGR